MRRLAMAAILAILLVPCSAFANHYADFYVIPVAISQPGSNNTNWMSDIAIYNFRNVPLTLQLTFIQSGAGNANNVEGLNPISLPAFVPAAGNVLLKDVLSAVTIPPRLGAVMVGGDGPFAVTSRTYNQAPNGTYGQTVPPARDFLENATGTVDNASAFAYIPGLKVNSSYRTNLGFVAATTNNTNGMTLKVTLRNQSGAAIATTNFFVGGGSFQHMQFSTQNISDQSFDIGSADFQIVSGSGSVVPYASVIDNATGDAVFIEGLFPPSPSTSGKTAQPNAFRALFDQLNKR